MSMRMIFFGDAQPPSGLPGWRVFRGADRTETAIFTRADTPPGLNAAAAARWARERLAGDSVALIELTPLANGAARVTISSHDATALGAPLAALAIAWDGKPNWILLNHGADVTLGPYESMVLPASRDSEAKLKAFVESIQGLPPDHAGSMLLALVMPTMESRVAKLELEAARSASQVGRSPDPGRRFGPPRADLRPYLTYGALGLLAIVTIGLGVLWLDVLGVHSALDRLGPSVEHRVPAAVAAPSGAPDRSNDAGADDLSPPDSHKRGGDPASRRGHK
jgi:hypothetical protein